MTLSQLATALCFTTSASGAFGLWQRSILGAIFIFMILSLATLLVDTIITRK